MSPDAIQQPEVDVEEEVSNISEDVKNKLNELKDGPMKGISLEMIDEYLENKPSNKKEFKALYMNGLVKYFADKIPQLGEPPASDDPKDNYEYLLQLYDIVKGDPDADIEVKKKWLSGSIVDKYRKRVQDTLEGALASIGKKEQTEQKLANQ